MAYMVNENCVACGLCQPECPNGAISDGETTSVIDPKKCTECVGAYEFSRCSSICSVNACVPDPSHREPREQSLEKWKKLHPGKTPAHS
jgi:ferredoxin